jgi:subtilase family serine protease
MNRRSRYVPVLVLALAASGCASAPRLPDAPQTALAPAGAAATTLAVRDVCPHAVAPGFARCNALLRGSADGSAPNGYAPSDLQSAYNLPSATNGSGQLVAIVDAYDDPNAEADLGVYRQEFGLPACTTANGCFAKVNQRGQHGTYPHANSGWAIEISLDVDMVSAGCPNCDILLVEANSNANRDLGRAVDEAVTLGAQVIAISYSAGSGVPRAPYEHHGVIYVASSGDTGAPGEPAAFPSVVAVGGTTLMPSRTKRGWTETAWGASGGCTTYAKPPWQHDTFCTTRTTNDVAAVADPSTGVAVYDTYEMSGWVELGGTSVSAPLIASVYGLAGNASALHAAQSLYLHRSQLFDIPPKGYDETTGEGTPDGVGAF